MADLRARFVPILDWIWELRGASSTGFDLHLSDTFWQEDAEAILAIPTDDEMSDWLAWYFESHRDVFAYILAVETADGRDASPLSSGQNNDGIFIWRFTQDKEKRSGTGYSMPSMQET
uniref:Uncharacterized protein n=1 Tax=Oryza punctata TaxID=4537 RepID=A0A0E0KIX8_ORYPU